MSKTAETINERIEEAIEEIENVTDVENIDADKIQMLENEIKNLKEKSIKYGKLSPWDRVQTSRRVERPKSLDYINYIFDDFIELHGDRYFGDDASIIGGIATINGKAVTVIGQQKGTSTEENIKRNFGMPNPEGYRKSLRLMKQAEKFKRPIITFIDTPGAFPGIGAEERGQGEAIARNLYEMATFNVPIISVIIGEGGSGGALALAFANRVFMLENSVYSILSPEGFASILWKDSTKAQDASEMMKITAYDLRDLGVVDKIIKEPNMGAETNFEYVADQIKDGIIKELSDMTRLFGIQNQKERLEKFRKF